MQSVSASDVQVRVAGERRVSVGEWGRMESRCPNEEDADGEAKCSGMMVLDLESRPNWKLCCNQCNVIFR